MIRIGTCFALALSLLSGCRPLPDSKTAPLKPEMGVFVKVKEADLHGWGLFLDPAANVIKDWKNHHDWLNWNVRFEKSGWVHVYIEQACEEKSAGSQFVLTMAGQRLNGTFVKTEGWDDYKQVYVGTLNIPRPGDYGLRLKITSKPGEFVGNLKGFHFAGNAAKDAMTIVRRNDIVSTFGWDGDKDAAIAFPGSFIIRDGRDIEVRFKIFEKHVLHKWYNHGGYLPCLVTDFFAEGCKIKIMNFANSLRFKQGDVVVAYSRVVVENPTTKVITLDPGASPEFIRLNRPSTKIPPKSTVNFDYAIVIDRFGKDIPWPTDREIAKSGSWDDNYALMKGYWDNKLAEIAQLKTPDENLNNAYKAGFIYTHIVKDGVKTHVGENGYDTMWDHDATGILATLLTIGHLSEAQTLLKNLPVSIQFDDGQWKYSWPFALYLNKTGDKDFVKKFWDTIYKSAHKIAADRTGPGGIIKVTNDIDTKGLWTVDNWSALFGLSTYRYLCEQLGQQTEMEWAEREYGLLLDAVNKTLLETMNKYDIDYIPASLVEPNDANRCKEPTDANWAAHFFFGRWGWDGWLAGARQEGPNLDMIDATYDYGFARLQKVGLPKHTYGGYPGYSTAYNAGYAGAALRGDRYRAEGIRDYQFMIANTMSGPFSWWEGILDPKDASWEGFHPSGGTGSCPHMWGQSSITKVLVESILAEFYDGRLLVGRGIPEEWLKPGTEIKLDHFPIKTNKRTGVTIGMSGPAEITLTMSGDAPSGEILLNLPVMVGNIRSASAGVIDSVAGIVRLPSDIRSVTVQLKKAPN